MVPELQDGTQEALRAFRFTLDPTPRQRIELARNAGASRWAYNFGLGLKVQSDQAWRERVAALVAEGMGESEARARVRADGVALRQRVRQFHDHRKALREEWRTAPAHVRATIKAEITNSAAEETALVAECIRNGLVIPSAFETAAQWRAVRDLPKEEGGSPWYEEVSSYAFTHGFANAQRAWTNFVDSRSGKRAGRPMGYPRFKKKGRCRDAFTLFHDVKKPGIRPERPSLHYGQTTVTTSVYRGLTVPRIGNIRLLGGSTKRLQRAVRAGHATVQSVTLSRSGDHWYASVLCKVHEVLPGEPTYRRVRTEPTHRQAANGTVGLKWDTGRITLHHDGQFEIVPLPRYLQARADDLAVAQRRASKAVKGSNRRKKANDRAAEIHHQIVEARKGWLHQFTARLARTFDTVAIEDLDIQHMTRATPPRALSRRRNRAVLDLSPGELRRQLTYKTSWYGSQLALTERGMPTTRTCSACGRQNPRPTPAGQDFHCDTCHLTMPRNHNAAAIIFRHAAVPSPREAAPDSGEAQNARGAPIRPDPTGARQEAANREDSQGLRP